MKKQICKFKVGDLVRYHAPMHFKKPDDPKYGVVTRAATSKHTTQCVYVVEWTNGRQTTEWHSYLRGVKNGN